MPVKLNPKSDSYEALMWDVLTDAQKFTPRPGMHVLDLGAHCGFFALYCAARGARVRAYEPNPALTVELVHAAAVADDIGIGRIDPIVRAIWSTKGTVQLFKRSDSSAAYTVIGNYPDPREPRVWCETLEDAMQGMPWDCVKVDIEGAEHEVFMKSDERIFKQIGFLTMEIHNDLLSLEQRKELAERLIWAFPHHKIYPVKGTEDIATLVCWQ